MNSQRLALLFRPYIARELPGWGRLVDALGIGGIDNLNPRKYCLSATVLEGARHGGRVMAPCGLSSMLLPIPKL